MALPVTARHQQRLAATPAPDVLMLERHFTYTQIAEMWSMSEDFVYDLFRDEPGVMLTKGKRHTARVPKSVMERVYASMSQGTAAR